MLISNSKHSYRAILLGVFVAFSFLCSSSAFADDSSGIDTGDTAWILTSTALFMTIPALALFYGGLVRTKNVLSILRLHPVIVD